jgi:hypothetical protein
MSEVVETYLRQAGLIEQRPKGTLGEVVAVEVRTDLCGEH